MKWRKSYEKEFPGTNPIYGAAMSPLVDNGLLIAHVGGENNGALRAFDLETGATKWNWTEDGPGYASPVAIDAGGTRQIVTQTQKHIVGVAQATGQTLWKVPFTTAYDQNAVTPVVYKDTGDLLRARTRARPRCASRSRARRGRRWKCGRTRRSRCT